MLFNLAKMNWLLGLITGEGSGVYFVVGSRSSSGRCSPAITRLSRTNSYYAGDLRSVMAVVGQTLLPLPGHQELLIITQEISRV